MRKKVMLASGREYEFTNKLNMIGYCMGKRFEKVYL